MKHILENNRRQMAPAGVLSDAGGVFLAGRVRCAGWTHSINERVIEKEQLHSNMKMNRLIGRTRTCLAAGLLTVMGAVTMAQAAAPALNGQVVLRTLTPQDIKDYSLTNLQGASGLTAVGVGQPAYLEALVNLSIAPSNIVGVTWVLTNRPIGSAAALASSPLGTNVPTYKMADRLTLQVAGPTGRTLLRPDVPGQYTVVATITTVGSGSTNLTQTITAGTYMGLRTCQLCHSGGVIAQDINTAYTNTLHARMFIDGINGVKSDHYSKNCISCHTVGYDANTNAVNGGFDDVATQLGWSFPTNLAITNWAAVPDQLKNLANIQCENCHGPGSEHAALAGVTNVSNWPRIGKNFSAGNCGQCHDSKNNHVKNAEWSNSRHAIATRTPSGPSRPACVRCHTAPGFKEFIELGGTTNTYVTNTVYEAITCSACHDPHDAKNPHQLRAAPLYTLPDGTSVTNAGLGALCMQCHHSRNGSATNNIVKFQLSQPTWAGGSSFGVHDSSQGDMVEGVNAITYGKVIPSGSHSAVISNVCVGCHMQTVTSTDPAFTKAGGHTFSMTYSVITNGVTNVIDKVDVCVKCHGPITSFDFARKDYNGDGVIEGVQTEVQKLLDKLTTLLPPTNYYSDPNLYAGDGKVKTSITARTNWPVRFLNAGYNWQFVNADASKGVHNAPFAVGLLKASIADLTGDANNDGLPDWWQVQYFGSANAANAAPSATPAGDGVPNWLKYSLGLNPTVAGVSVPGGVVLANGKGVVNPPDPGGTNTIRIYTAAEVVFATETGKTYQIQGASSLSPVWQNIGSPINGTGDVISMVVPTRDKVQQYYRVTHTP
jgi:hypothetical protein